jgi:uncharacterized membrane protein YedE/YeeE
MIEIIKQPWPWYIAGPLIGLTVPILLIIGNKTFGISSSMRHICAACLPANIPYFKYEWKKEIWNLLFVLGIFIGGFLGVALLSNPEPMIVDENLQSELAGYGISNYNYLVPPEIFSWQNLFSLQGFIMMVLGGFMIGFGTRYAGGCTSGHSIMGLSMLQWPSLIATCCFMIGGFIMANLIIPFILAL